MDQHQSELAIVEDAQSYHDACSYCSPLGEQSREKTSHERGLRLNKLSCAMFQQLIDRGWARSGDYLYKPDLSASCCPQYTIKLDVQEFAPSNSMRKIVNRWNRYIRYGDKNPERIVSSSVSAGPFDLVRANHASEASFFPNDQFAHQFEVALEPSAYSEEKFELYCEYQKMVHNDQRDLPPSNFERFLVQSPLCKEPIQYDHNHERPPHLPATCGSYHMTYRLDGELAAFSVLDILPACVSSAYFVYRPNLKRFSMGKLSIMREAALVREIHDAGARSVQSLYLGFYVHSCGKSKYKGEYAPSHLLDPESYEWYPLAEWLPLLEDYRYASIARPDRNSGKLSKEASQVTVGQPVVHGAHVD